MRSIAFISERLALNRWLKLSSSKDSQPCTLTSSFVRECPDDDQYKSRLSQELELIEKNNFEPIFLQVVNLLKHTSHIQHIVRGSAAGSLVSWMLGITHIDPIKHGMALERFMNHKRLNKPDIDLDFPQFLRNDVINILYDLYPNRVARICNHVMWRPQSAYREAIRRTKGEKNQRTFQIASELVNNHHYDSLHCGGVVIFEDKVPNNLIVKEKPRAKVVDYKIKYNKKETEDNGLIKIDILSNRGLSILHALDPVRKIHEYPTEDKEIVKLLGNADVLGITFCETPLVIKIIREIKPKNPIELSLCLALVRPAPNKKAVKERLFNGETNLLVYDDDVLQYIAEVLNTDLGEGEKIRKQLAKDEPGAWEAFTKRLKQRLPHQTVKKVMDNLQNVAKYGFCKSHSMNYAYMCWALLWHKAHNRDKFWCTVLTHAKNQYEDWVYFWQVQKEGYTVELVKYKKGKQEWKCNNKYLYCTNTPKKQTNLLSFFKPVKKPQEDFKVGLDQLRDYGYWNNQRWFQELNYDKVSNFFTGIVACWRPYKTCNGIISYVTVGMDNELWNIMIEGELPKGAQLLMGGLKILGPYEGICEEWQAI